MLSFDLLWNLFVSLSRLSFFLFFFSKSANGEMGATLYLHAQKSAKRRGVG